jgi:hypothetical protein
VNVDPQVGPKLLVKPVVAPVTGEVKGVKSIAPAQVSKAGKASVVKLHSLHPTASPLLFLGTIFQK